jgi:hypothetical protein
MHEKHTMSLQLQSKSRDNMPSILLRKVMHSASSWKKSEPPEVDYPTSCCKKGSPRRSRTGTGSPAPVHADCIRRWRIHRWLGVWVRSLWHWQNRNELLPSGGFDFGVWEIAMDLSWPVMNDPDYKVYSYMKNVQSCSWAPILLTAEGDDGLARTRFLRE